MKQSKFFRKFTRQIIRKMEYLNNKFILNILFKLFLFFKKFDKYEPEYNIEKHHYIPRFMLKNFKIGNDGLIYEYKFNTAIPSKSKPIGDVAQIEKYYDFKNIHTKKHSLYIEKELYSFIEDRANKIIDKIIQNPHYKLNDFKCSIISIYAAMQYTRTPAFRAQLKNFILFILDSGFVDEDLFSNENKIELLEIFLNNKLNISREDLYNFSAQNEKISRDVEYDLRIRLCNLDDILLFLSIQIGNDISEKIFRKEMQVLEAKLPLYFVLPDNGIIIFDPDDGMDWPYGWSLKDKTIFILPITPSKAIMFNFIKVDDCMKDCFIKLAISLSYSQSHNFIYFNKIDSYIQSNLDNFHINHNFN